MLREDAMLSACGVRCSDCPAYLGNVKGVAHQQRTAAAWKRIYGLDEPAERIACGGCLAPDDEVFHTCRGCQARLCCRAKGFGSCAECSAGQCDDLERAQALWDGLPALAARLSREDFAAYVEPYCNHRLRLADARRAYGAGVNLPRTGEG